ncbi:glutamate--tRNA ligase [Basilea psittacipulmonis]|uniref:Glutamate--tRNA ligase n=1 Tax=Basilea psittacipulmonis DSM 24701 TaxID=1072685 RepID=A0A077DHG0_9BURK|nr:glutamate--tRNA ligase [Basilea psittacipulmonis]AIL32977.1 glutamyl-tRNA synthetase [Basilea psittacipulmonis DSM 24701]
MSQEIRTRFAPSPTGYLHLGGARTALFSWAYARHFGGKFVLRIEDTDLERSTPEAVKAILEGMKWLDLKEDEGPFYQMQRYERHKEVIAQLLKEGKAYYCYSTPEEVEAMREKARAAGKKPKYDGTWRPEEGKVLPPIPPGRKPVVRFKNPLTGAVTWDDMLKGTISIDNSELDDLIIARPDGTPTYNFCVVVDDWDMGITHVIRGDDHVNNTPRQINILQAIGAPIPIYGHLPMINGPDGKKMSKRHGAVSIMAYEEAGYLPEAMINYLARLGWSHGDDEIFSREELVSWFDGNNLSKSPAQWDVKKLNWVNAHYMRSMDPEKLLDLVMPRLKRKCNIISGIDLLAVLQLFIDRAETLEQLADQMSLLVSEFNGVDAELSAQYLTDESLNILRDFKNQIETLTTWTQENIHEIMMNTLQKHDIKMPKLGIPLRVATVNQKQTPAIDAVLAILGKDVVISRLAAVCD